MQQKERGVGTWVGVLAAVLALLLAAIGVIRSNPQSELSFVVSLIVAVFIAVLFLPQRYSAKVVTVLQAAAECLRRRKPESTTPD